MAREDIYTARAGGGHTGPPGPGSPRKSPQEKLGSSCTLRTHRLAVCGEAPVEFPYSSLNFSFQMVPRMPTRGLSLSQSAKSPCPAVWGSHPPVTVMSTRLGRRGRVAHREPGPSRGRAAVGPRPPKLSCTVGARGAPEHGPCSLVEQGGLGWADNGGPAGRSGRSSAGHSWWDTRGNPCWPRWYLRWR